jgi:hypothetical protein
MEYPVVDGRKILKWNLTEISEVVGLILLAHDRGKVAGCYVTVI